MKYLKLVLPIVLLFTLSCDPPTGPEKKKDEKETKNVSISITKPSSGSSFEQGNKIPCEAKISGNENLGDKIKWKIENSNVSCENSEISLPSTIDPGSYKLEAYVDHDTYNLSDEVDIEITYGPKVPNVEITLPQFDEFLYTESSNIYLKATASDVNNNLPANTQIEWFADNTRVATSSPGQEIKIEAKPEYKKIVAKVKDNTDLTGSDSLKIGVYERVISFVEKINYENSNDSELSIYLDSPISREKNTVNLFKDIGLFDESENKHYISNFSFSPNGRYVAYLNNSSCDEYKDGLFIANYDFSNPKEVYCNEKGVKSFSWMPNGKNIIFTSKEKTPENTGSVWGTYLYKLSLETQNVEKIDRKVCNEEESNIPCYSPFSVSIVKPVSNDEILVGLKKAYKTHLFEGSDTIVEDRAKILTRINIHSGEITELWADLPTIGAIRPDFADISPNKEWVAAMSETYDETSTPADNRVTLFRTDGSTGKLPRYITSREENNIWEIFFSNNNSVCFKEGSALAKSQPTERLVKCRDLNGNYLYDRDYSEMKSISNITVYPQF